MTVETRYMRSDTQLINGLTAYKLSTTQSASALSAATLAKTPSVDSTLRPITDSYKGFPESYPVESPPPDTHYTDVDDVVADDMSSFVCTGDSTTYVYDRYGKTSFSLPSGQKIACARVVARVLTDYGSTTSRQADIGFGLYIGTTYYLSTQKKTNSAWVTYTQNWEKDPSTGLAWTQTGVNNAYLAFNARSYYQSPYYYYAYGTQIYMEIYTYTDDTVYYSVSVWKRDSGGTETAIETNIASYSSLINALHDAAGLKSATGDISPAVSLVSTDAIVVRIYQKVGAGSWTLVQTWTTEQLGAQSLDAATWTVYYFLQITASTSAVNSEFWFGHSSYDSKITNFTWTPVVGGLSIPIAMHHYSQTRRTRIAD